MRESRSYGSVRGALINERPYRVRNLWMIFFARQARSFLLCTWRFTLLPLAHEPSGLLLGLARHRALGRLACGGDCAPLTRW